MLVMVNILMIISKYGLSTKAKTTKKIVGTLFDLI